MGPPSYPPATNITSGGDPAQGSIEEQNRAYNDLERLTCENVKDIFDYVNQFMRLAARTGRMWIGTDLSDKFFRKMSLLLGKELENNFRKAHPGVRIGVPIRAYFTYQYLEEICKKNALQRSLNDLSFCAKISIPSYYQSKKKYGIRKATTYKGKPHSTHFRAVKNKYKYNRYKLTKCKCFICGDGSHFVGECPRNQGNMQRANYLVICPLGYD
ncbi:hypothetical protein V6N13_103604 [Hibiscus sabdariffa]